MSKQTFDAASTEKLLTFSEVETLIRDYFDRKGKELRALPGNKNGEIISLHADVGYGGSRSESLIYTTQLPEIKGLKLPSDTDITIIFTDHINKGSTDYSTLSVIAGKKHFIFRSLSCFDSVTKLLDQKLSDMISGLKEYGDYLDKCAKIFSDRAVNARLISETPHGNPNSKLGVGAKGPSSELS